MTLISQVVLSISSFLYIMTKLDSEIDEHYGQMTRKHDSKIQHHFMVEKSFVLQLNCKICLLPHPLGTDNGPLRLHLLDEHNISVIYGLGHEGQCISSVRFAGATYDDLAFISFRNISNANNQKPPKGGIKDLLMDASRANMN